MLHLPLVSIITVCRNSAATISRAIQSVENQTYTNIEYIVVDGASTDNTTDVIRSHSIVKVWLSEPDLGISDAINKGLALAQGEWIGILHADDWYEPDAVEHIISHALNADVIHGCMRFWKSASIADYYQQAPNKLPYEIYHPCQTKLLREMTINHPSVFVRRSVYEKEGGFDRSRRFAMDYDLLLRLYTRGYNFKQLDNIILSNMSDGGISDKNWIKTTLEVTNIKLRNGIMPMTAWSYFLWQITRGYIRRACEHCGLSSLVRLIRKQFSPMHKDY